MRFFDRFKRKPSLHSGGSGESLEEAVIINAPDHYSGVIAEYEYIARRYGPREVGWTPESQAVTGEMENGRRYDIITIQLASGEVKEIHFDITQFWGRL